VEILRMHCDFLKDENESIWFSFASQIASREVQGKDDSDMQMKKINHINKDQQSQLMSKLNQHRHEPKNHAKIEQMSLIMNKHYT